ncbi:MAG: cupin domain-containing protein [Pseudomonadota bacterium]
MAPILRNLDWVLSPIPQTTFFAEFFEQKHLVIKRGMAGYYRGLLSSDDVDRAVSSMGLFAPEVTVTNGAHGATNQQSDADSDATSPAQIRTADYTFENGYVDPVRVAQLFADGGTVILSGLQNRLAPLGQYTRSLEADLSTRVQANVYLTPGGNQGFRPHYDSHDVFVLQIEGAKTWRIYDAPLPLPLSSQSFVAGAVQPGELSEEFTLEPGDMAYIPRGLVHDAVADAGTSLHVTTGLMFRTWADAVAEAARVMAGNYPEFRHALPPGYAKDGFPLAAHEPYFRQLLGFLAEQAPYLGIMERFRSDFIDARVPRTEDQLRQAMAANALREDSLVGCHQGLIFRLNGSDGKDLVLSFQGAEITFPIDLEEAVRFALTQSHFVIRDLPGALDAPSKVVLVRRLIREGLLRVL